MIVDASCQAEGVSTGTMHSCRSKRVSRLAHGGAADIQYEYANPCQAVISQSNVHIPGRVSLLLLSADIYLSRRRRPCGVQGSNARQSPGDVAASRGATVVRLGAYTLTRPTPSPWKYWQIFKDSGLFYMLCRASAPWRA